MSEVIDQIVEIDDLEDESNPEQHGHRHVRSKLAGVALVTAEIGAVHETVEVGEGPIGRGVRVGEYSKIDGAVFGYVDIGTHVTIGLKTAIGKPLKPAKLNTRKQIVEDENVSRGEEFTPDISIGNYTKIGNAVRIFPIDKQTVTIGQYVQIENGVKIGKREKSAKKGFSTRIGDHSILAAQTIVLPGASIGSNVHIGKGYIIGQVEIPDDIKIYDNNSPKEKIIESHDWFEKNQDLWQRIPPIED